MLGVPDTNHSLPPPPDFDEVYSNDMRTLLIIITILIIFIGVIGNLFIGVIGKLFNILNYILFLCRPNCFTFEML